MSVLGYPKGSALELLDGTLKLRHCTEVFTMRFPPWSVPRVDYGSGKRYFVTPGHLPDAGSTVGKRVPLTRKTRPVVISHFTPDPGHPTPRRWKRWRPFPPKERRVRSASLAIFFLDLGLGEVLHLGTPGTCSRRHRRRFFPAGQSSRRDWCIGAVRFN